MKRKELTRQAKEPVGDTLRHDRLTLKNGKLEGRLSLEPLGKGCWGFHYPGPWHAMSSLAYDALEALDSPDGRSRKKAEALLVRLARMTDEHPLVLSEYGFFIRCHGKEKEGLAIIQKVAEKGRELISKTLSKGDVLEWSWIENRPFLRCLEWLGMDLLESGEHGKALAIFEEMLSLNPNDNQGMRETALECLLELGRPEQALELCMRYKDDSLAPISYGLPLVLLRLGKNEEARKALAKAVQKIPLVSQELLSPSKRRPKSAFPGYITLGAKDEAWEYRQDFGKYWEQIKGAMDFLKEVSHSSHENEK